MTYVVTERCVDCRYTYCVEQCPVDCFYEIRDPKMLVINPDECVHCDACVPLCPVSAIWAEEELPDAYATWKQKNADLWSAGTKTTEPTDPLDSALLLDEIQERERERGWSIEEPSGAE